MNTQTRVRNVFKYATRKVLQKYLQSNHVFDNIMNINVNDFLEIIKSLSQEHMAHIAYDFDCVCRLARGEGVASYIESGCDYEDISAIDNEYDIALTMLTKRDKKMEIFYDPIILKSVKRFWLSHFDSRYIRDRFTVRRERVDRLLCSIKDYMSKTNLKGKVYDMESFAIDKTKWFFLIRGSDLPKMVYETDWREIKIEPRHSYPVYDIAFVYDFKKGIIDVFCDEGGNRARVKLLKLFSCEILGFDKFCDNENIYDLSDIWESLKIGEDIWFEYSPQTIIIKMHIKSITLEDIVDKSMVSISLGDRDEELSIAKKIDRLLSNRKSQYNMRSMECTVVYNSKYRVKGSAVRHFSINADSRCDLGHDGIDAEIKNVLYKTGVIKIYRHD